MDFFWNNENPITDDPVTDTDMVFNNTPEVVNDGEIMENVTDEETDGGQGQSRGGGSALVKKPDVTIQLYDEQYRAIAAKEALYITTEPRMPFMRVLLTLSPKLYASVLYVKFEVRFSRTITDNNGHTHTRRTYLTRMGKFVPSFPSFFPLLGTTRRYEFDFGDEVAGGDAVISVYDNPKLQKPLNSYRFTIKGRNPTVAEIDTYIALRGYDRQYWFFKGLVMDESRYRQFTDEGTPTFGRPDGWGLTQRDQQYVDNPDLPYLWNWKVSIDTGATSIEEKIDYAVTLLNKQLDSAARKAFTDNPADFTKADDVTYGSITLGHVKTSLPRLDRFNAYFDDVTDDKKSFLDGIVIRLFNGGFFYPLKKNKDGTYTWSISIGPNNYVSRVCELIP